MKNFITEETRNELRRLTRRYEKYGVSYGMLKKLVLNAPQEISEDMAIIGIRMMLGETYNETEYFSMSDVCKVTGATPEELETQMKELDIKPLQVTSTIPGLFQQ